MKRVLIVATIAVILTGCTTAAQRQVAAIKTAGQQAKKEAITCMAEVYNKPEYASIVSHIPSPDNMDRYTMAQLADDSFPTKNESNLLIKIHDKVIPCKEELLKKVEVFVPPLAGVFADEMVEADSLTLKLVKRKITWGVYNQRRQKLVAAAREKAKPILRQMARELNAEHRDELAHRHMAIRGLGLFAKALANWSECRHAGASLEDCGSQQGHHHVHKAG